ncbi:hypothetical protein BC332_31042 [Capsicum chinense]|nr:hypothetical protein BC332_31042 [Capsicum chinense]
MYLAVSWKSSKQTCIASSTMEFEFIALDKAGEEAEWLRNFLKDISYCPKPMAPVCIHCDSQEAIGRAGSMMYNGKSRHIRQRHNTVRELLSSGIITVDYVKSKDNMSDPLTKGLSREGVERTSKGMSLRPRRSQHGGGTLSENRIRKFNVRSKLYQPRKLLGSRNQIMHPSIPMDPRNDFVQNGTRTIFNNLPSFDEDYPHALSNHVVGEGNFSPAMYKFLSQMLMEEDGLEYVP